MVLKKLDFPAPTGPIIKIFDSLTWALRGGEKRSTSIFNVSRNWKNKNDFNQGVAAYKHGWENSYMQFLLLTFACTFPLKLNNSGFIGNKLNESLYDLSLRDLSLYDLSLMILALMILESAWSDLV